MNTLQFLVQTVIGIYTFILIARAWFQFCKVDFYHPLSQSLVKLTQPALMPLRRLIPTYKNIDLAALLLVFILGVIKLPILLYTHNQPISGLSIEFLIIGLLTIVKTFGEMLFWAIFIRAIMSWFNSHNTLGYILQQITEPLLAPIRRILPNTGMLDFSVMVLGFILILANNLFFDIFSQLWLLA